MKRKKLFHSGDFKKYLKKTYGRDKGEDIYSTYHNEASGTGHGSESTVDSFYGVGCWCMTEEEKADHWEAMDNWLESLGISPEKYRKDRQ